MQNLNFFQSILFTIKSWHFQLGLFFTSALSPIPKKSAVKCQQSSAVEIAEINKQADEKKVQQAPSEKKSHAILSVRGHQVSPEVTPRPAISSSKGLCSALFVNINNDVFFAVLRPRSTPTVAGHCEEPGRDHRRYSHSQCQEGRRQQQQ